MIVNILLSIILVGGIQASVMFCFSHFFESVWFGGIKLLLANSVIFFIVIFIIPKCKIRKLACFVKDRSIFFGITACTCISLLLLLLVFYKRLEAAALEPIILLFISIILIFFLAGQLNIYKIKAKEVETELKMQKLYAESFKGLIDTIRLRQHEFDNHINTIYSQHYTCSTYEELVNVQRNYCKLITNETHFSKILTGGNSIIIGFLYVRLIEIEKEGIDLSYKVNVKDLDIGIPSYKIVEILGDLINNAVEAIRGDEEINRLHISVVEADHFYIEVRNESSYIDYKELGLFFTKDYSKKGENRGLGLFNVKSICEEYGLNISCQNIEIDERNWLSFNIWKEKETI